MNLRKPWVWCLGLAIALSAVLFFAWSSTKRTSTTLPIQWRAQPDSFPLGTVLQGSSVEINVGLLSDNRPSPPPAWIAQVPKPFDRIAESAVEKFRAAATQSEWTVKVRAPDFLRVDRSWIDYHSTFGGFPTVKLQLAADRPGNYRGQLGIDLVGRRYGTHTLLIPISATVIAKPSRWAVLVTETPFERYATDNGRHYEPLAGVITRLADRGVRVDFRSDLPKSLDGWNAILLASHSLVALNARSMDRLQRFVRNGGRLIVAADAFYGGTAPKANELLNRHGLRIDTNDAGSLMLSSKIAPDVLTQGVSKLSFFRPARVLATDPKHARILVPMAEDEDCGFIAVSRTAGRGDVVLLAQSLWWNWVSSERSEGDNARLLENLLSP